MKWNKCHILRSAYTNGITLARMGLSLSLSWLHVCYFHVLDATTHTPHMDNTLFFSFYYSEYLLLALMAKSSSNSPAALNVDDDRIILLEP